MWWTNLKTMTDFDEIERSALDLSRCFPNVFRRHTALYGVPYGWHSILYKFGPELERESIMAYDELDVFAKEHTPEPLYLTYAKEKWGRLDLSFSYYSDKIIDISSAIEDESMKVCQECGRSGFCKPIGGWYITLCDRCRPK